MINGDSKQPIYDNLINTFIQKVREAKGYTFEHETIVEEFLSLDEEKRALVVKGYMEAKEKVLKENCNFRLIAIGLDIAYCFGFSDDLDSRSSWLLQSCLFVRQQYKVKKIVGIVTEKNYKKEPTYDFCMIEFNEASEESRIFH